MTKEDALLAIQNAVDDAGGQSAFARASGVSQGFVSQVLSGKRPPSQKLLRVVGIEWKMVPAEGTK